MYVRVCVCKCLYVGQYDPIMDDRLERIGELRENPRGNKSVLNKTRKKNTEKKRKTRTQ